MSGSAGGSVGARAVMHKCLGPTETTICAAISGAVAIVRGCRRLVFRVSGRRCLRWIAGCARYRPGQVAGELYIAGAGVGVGIMSGGADRVTVCGLPIRRFRGTHVSHRGSGVLAPDGQLRFWGAPTIRSRSAGIASSSARVATALAGLAGVGPSGRPWRRRGQA